MSEALAQLKATNEQMLKTKDEQIAQLSAQLEKTKGVPQINEFRIEELHINMTLIAQIKLLCQQIAQAEPLCELTASVNEKIEKARTELDQAKETIAAFLDWQDTDQGQAANLPIILESNKDILFTEWQS